MGELTGEEGRGDDCCVRVSANHSCELNHSNMFSEGGRQEALKDTVTIVVAIADRGIRLMG